MITISTDMTHCIQFQEYDAQRDSGKDFLYISKTLNDGCGILYSQSWIKL